MNRENEIRLGDPLHSLAPGLHMEALFLKFARFGLFFVL